ncbi:MAG: hypothetical protein C0504_05875 [Candidatus Solibacter sp.]|nr:hypothetical protein [Candidatus Solibacter sp.]
MAVYKRGYQRYQGPRTSHLTRIMVMPRFSWQRLMGMKITIVVLAVSMVWPLLCAAFIYVANHAELWQGMGGELVNFLNINGRFFEVFMNTQAVFAMILAAVAGPGLIAPDLANNALPLYFSRPLTRGDYIISRLLVLLGMLSLVTMIPAMLLFVMQVGLAGWGWLADHWIYAWGVFGGFALWIAIVSLVAMACSAYVKWRVIAGALVLAFFTILAGAASIMNAVFRVDWGRAVNPALAMNQIWRSMLGMEPLEGPGAWVCSAVLVGMGTVLLAALTRKLRPVEVVK